MPHDSSLDDRNALVIRTLDLVEKSRLSVAQTSRACASSRALLDEHHTAVALLDNPGRAPALSGQPMPHSVIVGRLHVVETDAIVLGGGLRIVLSPGVRAPDVLVNTSLTVTAVSREGVTYAEKIRLTPAGGIFAQQSASALQDAATIRALKVPLR